MTGGLKPHDWGIVYGMCDYSALSVLGIAGKRSEKENEMGAVIARVKSSCCMNGVRVLALLRRQKEGRVPCYLRTDEEDGSYAWLYEIRTENLAPDGETREEKDAVLQCALSLIEAGARVPGLRPPSALLGLAGLYM